MTNPAETDLTGAQRSEQALEHRMQNNTTTEAVERLKAGLAMADRYNIGAVSLGERGDDINFADLSTLLAEHEAMRKALERLTPFAAAILGCLWEGDSLDGGDIQDLSEKHGLITETKFDPEVHTDSLGVGVYPGDPWFVAADWFSQVRQALGAPDHG